jgi:hypothetical protein
VINVSHAGIGSGSTKPINTKPLHRSFTYVLTRPVTNISQREVTWKFIWERTPGIALLNAVIVEKDSPA